MADEKNIVNYTAADIEKYWKGRLSSAEMHAIEKAAMDDPFLADALEGYKDVNLAAAGLETLKEKIDKRSGASVPVVSLKRKRFTWIKAAAAIIIIVGAGLLIQQLFSTRNNESLATFDTKEKQSENIKQVPPIVQDSINKNQNIQAMADTPAKSEQKASLSATINSAVAKPDDTNKKNDESDIVLQKNEPVNVTAGLETFANAERKNEAAKEKSDAGRSPDDSTELNDKKTDGLRSVAKPQAKQANYEADRFGNLTLNNTYNYRVVDAQNNPVPFANVMNTRDNVGTYTDIRGHFNLVSSDSVLNVQIKSLGYNAANYKLVPGNTQPGDLVLKEDERTETLVQNRKVVSSVSRKDSADIEEPEVGWGNYNTYVANNIQIPETVRAKNIRSNVELSFDIDKTGQPINIKVTRSSQCKECDEEARRLLKEGPKWKRKGKKSKATISIAVEQK
ncbi:MAG TPA: TonB family protein [Chitinophagaceae bacterium]